MKRAIGPSLFFPLPGTTIASSISSVDSSSLRSEASVLSESPISLPLGSNLSFPSSSIITLPTSVASSTSVVPSISTAFTVPPKIFPSTTLNSTIKFLPSFSPNFNVVTFPFFITATIISFPSLSLRFTTAFKSLPSSSNISCVTPFSFTGIIIIVSLLPYSENSIFVVSFSSSL